MDDLLNLSKAWRLGLRDQERSGSAGFRHGNFRRWALSDDESAFITRAGADVDKPVAAAGDLHIVFDHDDGVACVNKAMELGH